MYPSKNPDNVSRYFGIYYGEHRKHISEERKRKRREDPEYRALLNQRSRGYYQQEKDRLFDLSEQDAAYASLQEGVIPHEISERMIDLTIGFLVPFFERLDENEWVIYDTNASSGVVIRRKKTGVISVYQRSPVQHLFKKQESKNPRRRSKNTPRWVVIDDKYLFVYPVGVLVRIMQKHLYAIERWLKRGVIPSVCDRNGKYWIPEFVISKIRCQNTHENFGETDLESLFCEVKGPVYVY